MDYLARLMKGKGIGWQVPADGSFPETYFEHMKAASKRPKVDARGNVEWKWHYRKGHDRFLQGEKLALLAAIIRGRLGAGWAAEQPPAAMVPKQVAA